ncbi:MAG: NgoBV family restriction endonuclease [Muribaculaceae bacterium]|nr:NgoBV family restriction endonuclease [Muribaculaceae bacterium]
MRLTAQEIFDKLVNDDKILTKKGRITFSLGEIDIIVRQKDVVGNIMQEWMEGWFRKNDIEFAPNDNTQMPPDFYLNPQN